MLSELLPSGWYDNNTTMLELQSILDALIAQLSTDLQSTVDNCFLQFADELIARYETIVGITPNAATDLQVRIDTVLARIRGASTCTLEKIKDVINAYFTEASVSENSASYSFVCSFAGSLTDRSRIAMLQESINEIKPAHLQSELRYHSNHNGVGYRGACFTSKIKYNFEEATEC